MRERRVLWVVLAAFVVGMIAVAGLAAVDGDSGGPPRLPALAVGAAGREAAAGAAAGAPTSADLAIGPVEYRVAPGALDVALPDHASAWNVDDRAEAGDVARLADALGVDGAPKANEAGWQVADADHVLDVFSVVAGQWSYQKTSAACGPDTAVSSDGVTASCGITGSGVAASATSTPTVVAPCPMPDCPPNVACAQVCPTPSPEPLPAPPPPERPADLPSKAEAERIGRAFLEKAGADLDGADVRVDDGFSQWLVSADPRVGGLPTQGFGWSVAVGPKGEIEYANGWLADPTEGADYPLAGVQAGVDRLKSGYPGGGWSPYPGAPEPAIARDMPVCADCPPQVRTITGVRLGLQFAPVFRADGAPTAALLVPSYLFRFEDSDYEQAVVAVADEFLPKPPAVKPMPAPEPAPMPVEPNSGAAGRSTSPPPPARLPADQRAEVGRGYYVDVSTHCGVYALQFDGRWWDADPPLGDGNSPPGWSQPTEGGTFTLTSPTEGDFVGDAAGTKTAHFVARAPDAGDPPGCA